MTGQEQSMLLAGLASGCFCRAGSASGCSCRNGEWPPAETLGQVPRPVSGHRWLMARQYKVWRPPTDVYETDTHVIVKVEIAGMAESDFSIALNARVLTISGVRHDPAAKLTYQQMEILYGEFETEVLVPWTIDENGIEATYRDGFLSVSLRKLTPRHIPIAGLPETPA